MTDPIIEAMAERIRDMLLTQAIDHTLPNFNITEMAKAAYIEALPMISEMFAKAALDPRLVQARDDEWDTGFNDGKRIIASVIRALAAAKMEELSRG
jgi:uncharacterized membrane protein